LLERELRLAQSQIAVVENLRDDIGSIVDLKVHDRGFAILKLVEGWQFACVGLEVCELTVVPYGPDEERTLVLRGSIDESQLRGILLRDSVVTARPAVTAFFSPELVSAMKATR
jgi:hypothetical protein